VVLNKEFFTIDTFPPNIPPKHTPAGANTPQAIHQPVPTFPQPIQATQKESRIGSLFKQN
jgi:hypothetical protein